MSQEMQHFISDKVNADGDDCDDIEENEEDSECYFFLFNAFLIFIVYLKHKLLITSLLHDVYVSMNAVFVYVKGELVPKNVISIIFHSSVTEVPEAAFKYCRKLKKVVFNEGLRKICDYAFYGCISLVCINLPSTVVDIGSHVFCGTKLREVVLNEGLLNIGNWSFDGCYNLECITFPSTLTEIGQHAFRGCRKLKRVDISEGSTKIGQYAFCMCTSLKSITLPSTLTDIGGGAFQNCSTLREVILHEGIQKIGMDTFKDCACLESFKLPSISARLHNIIEAGQIDINNELNDILGSVFERRDNEILIPATTTLNMMMQNRHSMGVGNDPPSAKWNAIKESLESVVRLIAYYEMMEGTTIFELALWKAQIDSAENSVNRQVCRIDVPGPVKDAIIQYLK